jgi:hypothetical protein
MRGLCLFVLKVLGGTSEVNIVTVPRFLYIINCFWDWSNEKSNIMKTTNITLKKKQIFVFLLAFLFTIEGFAQLNIVNNYDFSDYSNCPNAPGELNNATSWENPDVTIPYAASTPDFMHNCCPNNPPPLAHAFSVPRNFWGYQPADAGDGYITLITYSIEYYANNYREYAKQELRCGLINNIDYEISFKVCLANEHTKWGSNGIGMAFSANNLQITGNSGPNYQYLALNPNIVAANPIMDTVNWTRISGIHTATGNEQYVYLGNFWNDAQTNISVINANSPYQHAAYYVDSIRIRPLNLAWDDDSICEGDSVEICAYPCQGWSYYWTSIPNDPNLIGQVTQRCINVSPTQTTQYIVKVTDHYGNFEYDTVEIYVYNIDQIQLDVGVYTGCKDVIEDSILNYNPAYNYSWGLSSSGSFTSITSNPFSIPWAAYPNGGWLYFITEDPANGCSRLDSIEVFPCCKNPDIYFWQDTVITQNSTWTGSSMDVYVDGYLRIDGCVVNCDNYNFYFNPNARVEIVNGGTFSIDEVNMLACDTFYMWDGVYIENYLSSFIADESTIKNAKNAVVSEEGGIYTISSTNFEDNYKGIVVEAYTANHTGVVSSSIFRCNGLPFMYPPYVNTLPHSGIAINDVRRISIGDSLVSSTYANEFNNLKYGIYNQNAYPRIFNNDFIDIDDKGIYSINGSFIHNIQIGDNSPYKENRFTNCNNAIYIDNNQNVTILNNDFTNNVMSAIYIRNHKRRKNIEIAHNTITGSIFGISMLDLWRSNINVHDNIVDGNAIGIVYNSTINRRVWLKIINNSITNAHGMGIQLINAADYAEIKQNVVDFTYNGGTSQYGIDVDNSNNVEIFNNDITNQTATAGALEGIAVSQSPEAWLCGNYTEDLMYGLSFEGNMPLTKIQTTQMQDCVNGMNFTNSYVGDQGSMAQPWDNRWYQLATNYRCLGSMSAGHNWYQRGGVYNPNISGNPPNGILPFPTFINTSYTNPFSYISCEYIVSSLALGSTKESELENIAEGLNTYTMLEEENEYREQLYLLREIKNMGKTKQRNDLISSFALSSNYSNMVAFENYMDEIEAEDVQAAYLTNKSISVNNKMEEVMKEVNSIYLQSWAVGRYDLESWEYDRLYEIACLEPMIYGEGVYTARVMTDYILTTIKKTRQSEQENVKKETICDDIYPNPAQQTASIDYNSESSSVLRILNLSGQELAKYELKAGNYSFSFDVSKLQEGVYIYLLENNSSLIKYGKFVIIH